MDIVKFQVEDLQGTIQNVEVPSDINLSLMEVLKASEYNILATCGGMALCATCHVDIEDHEESLGETSDAEMDMLDTLPDADFNSRLACQIRVSEKLEGVLIRLRA